MGNMLGPNPKKVVKEYDIVPYRSANGKYGLENHNGVMNEWAKNNVYGYREFERVSPTIAAL